MAMIKESKQRGKPRNATRRSSRSSCRNVVNTNALPGMGEGVMPSINCARLENDIKVNDVFSSLEPAGMNEMMDQTTPTAAHMSYNSCSLVGNANNLLNNSMLGSERKIDGLMFMDTSPPDLSLPSVHYNAQKMDVLTCGGDCTSNGILLNEAPGPSCYDHSKFIDVPPDPIFPPPESCDAMLPPVNIANSLIVDTNNIRPQDVPADNAENGKKKTKKEETQVFVFSTELANKSAESVLEGHYPNIIAYHLAQTNTQQFLENHPNKSKFIRRPEFDLPWRENPNSTAKAAMHNPHKYINSKINCRSSPYVTSETLQSTRSSSQIRTPHCNQVNSGNEHSTHGAQSPVCSNLNLPLAPASSNIDATVMPLSHVTLNRALPTVPSAASSTSHISSSVSNHPQPSPAISSESQSSHSQSSIDVINDVSNISSSHQPDDISDGVQTSSPHSSLTGVKVPDEDLTPQQRQHREEQLATLRKMQQMLFPEHMQEQMNAAHHENVSNSSVNVMDELVSTMSGKDVNDIKAVPTRDVSSNCWRTQRKPSDINYAPRCNSRSFCSPPCSQSRCNSVPVAIISPNINSPNSMMSNISLPSPRACCPLNSPVSRHISGPSPISHNNTPVRSPGQLSQNRQSNNISNPASSPSPSGPMHRSPTLKNNKDHKLNDPVSNEFSPTTNNSQQSPDGVFCRSLQSLAQQQQKQQQKQQSPVTNNNYPSTGSNCKEPNLMPVPSPQHIQYLNTFDGQELTIQKQPNTSIKDSTNIMSPSLSVSILDQPIPSVSSSDTNSSTKSSCSTSSISLTSQPLEIVQISPTNSATSSNQLAANNNNNNIINNNNNNNENINSGNNNDSSNENNNNNNNDNHNNCHNDNNSSSNCSNNVSINIITTSTAVSTINTTTVTTTIITTAISNSSSSSNGNNIDNNDSNSDNNNNSNSNNSGSNNNNNNNNNDNKYNINNSNNNDNNNDSNNNNNSGSGNSKSSANNTMDLKCINGSQLPSNGAGLLTHIKQEYDYSSCTSPQLLDQQHQQYPFVSSNIYQRENFYMNIKQEKYDNYNYSNMSTTHNIPLNPSLNANLKSSKFDPISSLTQMSQQLTSNNNLPAQQINNTGMLHHSAAGGNTIPFNSQPANNGSPNGTSEIHSAGYSMNNNLNEQTAHLDNQRMMYSCSSMLPNMPSPPGSMVLNNNHRMMVPAYGPNASGNGMVHSKPLYSGNTSMSPPVAQSQYQMMAAVNQQRMMMNGHVTPGGPSVPAQSLSNSYNTAGTNIQVKPNAPNTIQYLPTRPPQCPSAAVRGPPSLEFLHRYSNPMPPPPTPNMDGKIAPHNPAGTGYYQSSATPSGMNYHRSPPQPSSNNSNNANTINNSTNNGINDYPVNNTAMPYNVMARPTTRCMPQPHNNCPPAGASPMRLPSPAIGANYPTYDQHNQPQQQQMYSPIANSSSMPLVNSDFYSAPSSSSSSSSFNMQSCTGYPPPDATQPLPPSIGQSNNFKNPGFVGPTTADPNYAQQFHHFQQQLYATNTRGATQMGAHSATPANQQYFMPK